MEMELKRICRNSHVLHVDVASQRNYEMKIAMLSDLHLDNPKTDMDLVRKHLDHCKENNIRIHLNGDTFCLMQGKYDPRSSKKSIRPEHNTEKYLDTVIKWMAEFFKPYAHLIDVVGYGNHETAITRRQETDVVERFVERLNSISDTEHQVQAGGYGGWYIIKMGKTSYKIHYFHGSGGGGIVTKGHINLTRAKEMLGDFDCFTMGHVHENTERWDTLASLDKRFMPINKDVLLMITGTYKEEFDGRYMGWHVERGAPPKPIGGRILTLTYKRPQEGAPAIKAKSERFVI